MITSAQRPAAVRRRFHAFEKPRAGNAMRRPLGHRAALLFRQSHGRPEGWQRGAGYLPRISPSRSSSGTRSRAGSGAGSPNSSSAEFAVRVTGRSRPRSCAVARSAAFRTAADGVRRAGYPNRIAPLESLQRRRQQTVLLERVFSRGGDP